MRNYFNYFTEVEERFQQRRGTLLMLSTLDWALIESWQEAGVPLEAVLRGVDEAFAKHEAKKAKSRARRVNGLAWCAQAVMEAAEQMRDAATGLAPPAVERESGLEAERIAAHLEGCRAQLVETAALPEGARSLAEQTAARLGVLGAEARAGSPDAEALEETLRALEERLLAILVATLPEGELEGLRAHAAREIAPYRSRMHALQVRQIEKQFLEKRLLEKYGLPRLSLFYMRSGE